MPLRCAIYFAIAVVTPVFLTQCQSTGGSYRDVEYDSSTLKTPSGHGLKKSEYPFDDSGNYRKDWVKNKDAGRAGSSYKQTTPEPSTAVASVPASSSNFPSPVSKPASSGVTVTSTPPVVSSSYHKVRSGETLYSLSRKYNTSIAELKRMNGLTGDAIRDGQSLRVP